MKPNIHLWIFNHPFYGISDQIDFFLTLFKQYDYVVTIGKQPRKDALNFVIENFSEESKRVIADFCLVHKKRIAVIMTEHLDFSDKKIFIHGDPLWSHNDYMHPATQINRIRFFIDCLPNIRFLVILGDLPKLLNLNEFLPGLEKLVLHFPSLKFHEIQSTSNSFKKSQDLLFTGFTTEYRKTIMSLLARNNFSVYKPDYFVSRHVRDIMMKSSKFILNIPQRESWEWLSLMRIIAALKSGRHTLSLSTNDKSEISHCTTQLSLDNPDFKSRIQDMIDNWKNEYSKAYENYMHMHTAFKQTNPFPHNMLEYWAITDNL